MQMGICINETNGSNISIYARYDNFREEFFFVGFNVGRAIIPFWIIIGIFGNTLSCAVWGTPKLRRDNSSAVYLAAISLSDLMFLVLYVAYYINSSWSYSLIDYVGICKLYNMLNIFFQFYSIPLVFAFTLERWIAICYPFQRERLCNPRRAMAICGFAAALVFVFAMLQLFLWSIEDVNNPVCRFNYQLLGANTMYIITAIEMIFSAFLPILILVFNILVIKELRRITQSARVNAPCVPIPQVRQAPPSNVDNENNNGDDSSIQTRLVRSNRKSKGTPKEPRSKESSSFRSTTIMLLTVSFYLILCTLTAGIMYIGQFIINDGNQCLYDHQIRSDPVWHRFFIFQNLKECIDAIGVSHYACNFIIYLTTGKAYRKQALKFLSCGKWKAESDDPFFTGATGTRGGESNGKGIPLHSRC